VCRIASDRLLRSMRESLPAAWIPTHGLAEKIECPLLILHGEADPIFSAAGVQRIYDEAKSKDKTILLYPNAWHCSLGYDNEAARLMADWMAERLK